MEEKKFYKEIQQKIDQNNFDFDWNQSEVWQRIEQKNTKKKPFLAWWKAAAASIVLLSGIGAYFAKNNTQIIDNQIVKNNKIFSQPQTIAHNTITSIQQVSAKKTGLIKGYQEKKIINKVPENSIATTIIESQILEKPTFEKQEIAVNEEKTVEISDPVFSEKSLTFIANPAILEVRIPKKKDRIAILEIPEDDETYNIQRKEKLRGYAARMARKMNKTTDELPSINGKPNKVWAFVKESFKNETVVDSTVK